MVVYSKNASYLYGDDLKHLSTALNFFEVATVDAPVVYTLQ